ncbi:hypothetical protein [Brachybacterium paraconglomeratum]|uniref:hypothetical protein n=1 Tax=Brachybacterium paraconglomeratum TaxID=173362 RepID=UPI0022E96125|nr:hypothetical protein [Brachybacterium paraconglomeratum]
MGDRGREQAAQGAGASSLGAVAAAGGAVAMAQAARMLGGTAGSAHGEEQLIGWVLVGLAGAGALLCLYLAVIWGLAAAILLAGPAGRIGRMLLPALRVLAPRLARRVSMGAAVATAATGLVLGPALASEQLQLEESAPTTSQTSQELPADDPATPEPEDPEESGAGEPLPSLGWGGDPAPTAEEPATSPAPDEQGDEHPTTAPARPSDEDTPQETGTEGTRAPEGAQESPRPESPDAEASPDSSETPDGAGAPDASEASDTPAAPAQDSPETPSAAGSPSPATGSAQPSEGGDGAGGTDEDAGDAGDDGSAPPPRTVVVQKGDTLWSLTDDVLGPGPDDPALLAEAWPLLHQENRDVIGEDPDLLVPGQVLTVPAALDEEARS